MTKADIIKDVSTATGVEKVVVQQVVESFMEEIKGALTLKKISIYEASGLF